MHRIDAAPPEAQVIRVFIRPQLNPTEDLQCQAMHALHGVLPVQPQGHLRISPTGPAACSECPDPIPTTRTAVRAFLAQD